MTPEQLGFLLVALSIAAVQIFDRLDRRADRKRAEMRELAQDEVELKDQRIDDLQTCVDGLEKKLKDAQDAAERAQRGVEGMRKLMRLLFDELARSDRCRRAALGCPTREIPGDMNPELAKLRAELDADETSEETQP